ncbi:uncharacterized protein LOC100208756 [Hydra vulgaris]|uniref:Uncharacterized protein LOC100208756 n=1 Tax=Hydra vulgaris TaxID=6087 RepID=A0ABM4CZ84_HYDVU
METVLLLLIFTTSMVTLDLISGAKQRYDYTITLKTGRGLGAGTDSVFNLTFIGFEKNVTYFLDGEGSNLEAGSLDVFNFTDDILVYPINKMILQRIQKRGYDTKWYLNWLIVDVLDAGYIFSVNKWIRDDNAQGFTSFLNNCKDGFVRYQECRRL